MKRSYLAVLAVAANLLLADRTAMASQSVTADQDRAEADALVQAGNPEAAEPLYRDAADRFQHEGDPKDSAWAKIQLAAVYQQLGRADLAYNTFHEANVVALKTGNGAMLATIDNGLGSLAILSGTEDTEDSAESLLKKSYSLATSAHAAGIAAAAANNLGELYSYERNYSEAEQQYERAIHLAEQTGDPASAARSEGNLARVELDTGNFEKAKASCEATIARVSRLPDSHDKAFVLIGAGDALNKISLASTTPADDLRLAALKAYQAAAATANRIGDKRSLSYALGYEGQLYETEGRTGDALTLTRQALFFAQQIGSPYVLYLWEWQVGRLLKAQGETDESIKAYQRAEATLEGVRHDVALHYGNPTAHSSFRNVTGGLYTQLSDLLIQKADRAANDKERQGYLKQARDTTERLKSAELEDYFQDQCAAVLKANEAGVDSISDRAAVVYIIPLPDRTEILVTTGSGAAQRIENVRSNITDDQLTALSNQFRTNLEKRSTDEYLDQADALYADLIKPVEGILVAHHIDTLVFVPDGALRTIPMAALRDGDKFLIQKYAIAVTPGLTLMQAKSLREGHVDLIMNGISQPVQGFAPLEHVPEEIKNVAAMFGGSKILMNNDFNDSNFHQEFATANYSIVHIASHGHFDDDSRKTFVLTFDKKVGLDELEQLLSPTRIKDKPVELLSLSACETAAGDDRAALGLAGVAIKAGARSAFATLWCVNDEASSVLVSDFYASLKTMPTKAMALQHAQCKLIADPRYSHPCLWAPYLLIGNWL